MPGEANHGRLAGINRTVSRPYGRDEIVTAVVEAATGLMAERGPAAVSLRDVAQQAGVNLSQIHRHIGNKEALLEAILAADVAARPDLGVEALELDFESLLKLLFRLTDANLRTRLQARIIIDGYDLPALQDRYPGIELAIKLLEDRLPVEQARVRTAAFTSFLAGWLLLGPSYLRVTGMGGISSERFTEIMAPVLDAIAKAPAGPEPSNRSPAPARAQPARRRPSKRPPAKRQGERS
jgi:AcrR family transcriptional regulator